MQRYPFFLLVVILCSHIVSTTHADAQFIPQRVQYQGIARDGSGAVLPNTAIGVRISILNGSAGGSSVYGEEHNTVTNEFGLFSLQIGGGNVLHGNFSAIDWNSNLKFMRVEVDLNNEGSYSILGTSQLLSVPYALAAGKPTNMSISELKDVELESPSNGETLVWNGDSWVNGTQPASVVASPRLSGNGSAEDPLDIARQGASFEQVLKWNGTSWEPGEDEGEDLDAGAGISIVNGQILHDNHTGDVTGTVDLSVVGIRGNPIVAVPPTTGQVLKYVEGQGWIPSTDNSLVLFAGNGLDITGNTIKNTAWQVGSDKAWRISGSVGIGTSTPTDQLHLTKDLRVNGAFKPNGNAGLNGQVLTSSGVNSAPTWKKPEDLVEDVSWSLSGNAGTNPAVDFLGTTDSKPLLIKTGNSERVRIDASGNVGIGATSPGAPLEVGGGDVYVNGAGNGVVLKAPDGGCWKVTVDNSGNLTTTSVSCP